MSDQLDRIEQQVKNAVALSGGIDGAGELAMRALRNIAEGDRLTSADASQLIESVPQLSTALHLLYPGEVTIPAKVALDTIELVLQELPRAA